MCVRERKESSKAAKVNEWERERRSEGVVEEGGGGSRAARMNEWERERGGEGGAARVSE